MGKNLVVLCAIWLWVIPFIRCDEILAYSFEVWLKDRPDDDGDYWPIIDEYDDPSAFKAGNFSAMNNNRRYISLLLTPAGYLVGVQGKPNGFDNEGDLGRNPANESTCQGFEIEDEMLLYRGGSDWTACPMRRGSTIIYTIKYGSDCIGGYSTNITRVGIQEIDKVSGLSSLLHLSTATTTLLDNSFQSMSATGALESSSPAYRFSILQALLGLILQLI